MASGRVLLTRRNILRAAAGTAGGLIVLGGGLAWNTLRTPTPFEGFRVLDEDEARFVRALAQTHLPPDSGLGVDVESLHIDKKVDGWLYALDTFERRLVRGLLRTADNWPRVSLRSTSRFTDLALPARIEILDAWDADEGQALPGFASLLRIIVGLHIFEDERVLAGIGFVPGCPAMPG